MGKLTSIITVLLFVACTLYAGEKEIVRKVDDFTEHEIVTFKDPLKFERTKGVSVATAWLTPEAAKKPDGTIDWMRLHLVVQCNQTGMITRDPVRPSSVSKGTLKLKIDDSQIIELKAINRLSEVDFEISRFHGMSFSEYIEESVYELSQEQLQAIAMSSTVKARVTGMNNFYYDLPHKHYRIHQDWLNEMRRFYSEVLPVVSPEQN